MEAGVTTATKRLRRASIAGLATIATAGVTVLASGGTALAFVAATNGATAATLASGGSATLAIGSSSQALSNLTLKFPANSSANEFSAGERITFTLDSDGAGPNGTTVNDGSNTLNTASFAGTPTATGTNGGTATVALTNGNGTNDAFTLTFTSDAAKNSTATEFTISGLKVNLGSKVDVGQTISIDALVTVGTNQNIFWNGAAATNAASVDVGTIPQVSVSASKVAVSAGGATGVALGTLTIKDVAGGSFANGDTVSVVLDNSAQFTTKPTATGTPSVSNITIATTNTANDTVTFQVNADSAAGNTITLTGAKITNAANGKAVTATVDDATTALGIAGTAKVAVAVAQSRLGGADRYGTASLVFNDGNNFTSSSVILTSGTNFPDALSAQYLASALSTAGDVGILTTDPNNLTASTRNILANGTIDTVYIVGGTAAVSANVANQVAALHVGNVPINANLNVIRIAGADRYATNNAADLFLGAAGSTHAYIATGANFADALAIGPVVYATGDPLILTDTGSLNASAKSTLESLGITNVTIVGGTAAVSTAVETALTNMNITIDARLAGADRTQTAAAIAQDAVANQGFSLGNVYIARGDSFADALVAGPLAGVNQNPILLTSSPTTLGAGIPSVLGSSTTTTSVTALGLTSAISVQTLNAAAASIGG